MSSELKPCPFCGGEAELRDLGENRNPYIFCDGECSFVMDGDTKEETIKAWNTRAERTCTDTDKYPWFECSECGWWASEFRGIINFCPTCGAKVVE